MPPGEKEGIQQNQEVPIQKVVTGNSSPDDLTKQNSSVQSENEKMSGLTEDRTGDAMHAASENPQNLREDE